MRLRALPALLLAAAWLGFPTQAQAAGFGFLTGTEGFDVQATKLDGTAATQAGSHPYQLAVKLGFDQVTNLPGQPGVPFPAGDLKDISLELPPGLVGNPTVASQCTLAQFNTPRSSPWEASLSGESCPDSSQVGVVAVKTSLGGGEVRHFGVFNLTPPPGYAVELGFAPFGAPVTFGAHVRNNSPEYGLTAEIQNFPQALAVDEVTIALWGTPWALSHDTQRGNCLNEANPEEAWGKCSVGPPRSFHREAFLTLPTSCGSPLAYKLTADSWQEAGNLVRDAAKGEGQIEGCQRLSLETFSWGQPTSRRAASGAGFEFNLEVKQEGIREPGGLAGSQIKQATVSLPEGMTINPSVGAGLGVCSPVQYAQESASSPPGSACPNDSKIGDFRVQSPLIEETLTGSVFLARPFQNPFGSLIAVYLVARSSARGILVKTAGKLVPDPTTGRITGVFDNLPQLPYSHLRLFFREGQRAPLTNPPSCGTYVVHMDLNPWLAPETILHHSSEFEVTEGTGGSACPPATPPFIPKATDGSINPNAGSYSPYYLHLTRTDTEQEITSYSAILPPGLTGKLTGIPYCPETAIAAAKAKFGVEEQAHSSCPAASEIGHTVAGFGLGGVLDYAPGRLYLAGPYRGAPLSIVAVDPALVGPFDLGVIVVRSAIRIDPYTAQVSIDTQGEYPFPHIIDGIPIHLRDVRVYISRPEFTLNPTSCEPFTATSTLAGSSPPFTNPADVLASVSNLYQVTNCPSLGFAPKMTMRLRGKPTRGSYPSLFTEVTERGGNANIGSAVVTLPPSEFLAQNHIREVCTERQFAEGGGGGEKCPAASIYGHAKAITPLLPEPLEGPVYLRSNGGVRPLPDMVVALSGDNGIAIDLLGYISSYRGGMRASFFGLPDAPAAKFILTLEGGRRGLLQNSANLCAVPGLASARFLGQSNLGDALGVPLRAQCAKHGKGKRRRAGRRG